MIRSYSNNKTGDVVRAIEWTGENLGEVIDLIGLHQSVEHLKWEDYEKLVREDGFVIFNSTESICVPIGYYVTGGIHGYDAMYPIVFLNEYTVIEKKEKKKVGKRIVPMEEIKKWIPLAKMESASQEEYQYRIQAAYDVPMQHQALTPIPYVGEKEVVLYEYPELVALCPVTFLPDVYKVDIRFIPGKIVPELKSLKYNLLDYIELPISHEHLASRIYRDLKSQIDPDKLEVVLHTNVRGGITTTVTVGDKF